MIAKIKNPLDLYSIAVLRGDLNESLRANEIFYQHQLAEHKELVSSLEERTTQMQSKKGISRWIFSKCVGILTQTMELSAEHLEKLQYQRLRMEWARYKLEQNTQSDKPEGETQ